jgi:hypothetical protein
MRRSLLGSTTWVLVVTVVTVLAATTASTVAHDLQHAAHHTAGLHSTGVCAWMCAAGQVLEEFQVALQADVSPSIRTAIPLFREPSGGVVSLSASRAPPALFS